MEQINLSHSRASTFCGMQIKYRDILRAAWKENFFTARGHIGEAGVNAELQNRMTGVEGKGIREEMLSSMEELLPKMDNEQDQRKLADEFEKIVTSVEYYNAQIDYTPIRVQEWFGFSMDGNDDKEHPVKGCIDIIAERVDSPLIIDIKYKSSPIKKDNYDYRMQVALYSLWLMQARNLNQIPKTEIHVLLSGKAPQIWNVDVTVEDMYEAIYRLKDLAWRLTNQYFPLARNHPLCSPRWCGFWDQCHIDNFQSLDNMLSGIRP